MQKIIILAGLPGSGKSTYLKQLGVSAISSDDLRGLLMDDVTNQTIHRQVFRFVREILKERIALGREVSYVDATNLTVRDRRPYIKIGDLYGCQVEAVFFDVPLEVCKQRNSARRRAVPNDAIDAMAARLVRPTLQEGFSHVSTAVAPPTTAKG